MTIILVKAQDSRIPRQPEERQKTARLPLQIVNQHARFGFTVIDGAAPGADTLAYEWASERGLACKRYPADWTRHGRAAGPLRDAKMMIEGSRTSWLHFRAAAGLRTWFGGPAPQMLWLSTSVRRILMTSVSELEERVATLQRQLDDVREALLLFAAEAAPYDHERGIKFPDHMLAWDFEEGWKPNITIGDLRRARTALAGAHRRALTPADLSVNDRVRLSPAGVREFGHRNRKRGTTGYRGPLLAERRPSIHQVGWQSER